MESKSRQSLNRTVTPEVRQKLDDMGLLFYDELSDEVKPIAFNCALFVEEQALSKQIDEQRKRSSLHIHKEINNPYHISSLVRISNYIKRYRVRRKVFEHTIIENLAMFNSDGMMFLFTEMRFANEPK